MYFLIEDDDLLEKHNTIWDKVSAHIKKQLDSEPIYNKTYWKTNIKPDNNEVTNFYHKKFRLQSYLFHSSYLGFCSKKR